MSNVVNLPERRDPQDEAADWIARLDRGLDAGEEAALRRWLAADPANTAALMEAAKFWDKLSALSRLADLFPQRPEPKAGHAWAVFALAATMLLAIGIGYWATMTYRADVPPAAVSTNEHVFHTAVGEYSTVMLPDGSRATLNTDSLVRVRFTRSRRLLVLERGEVYVEVAHDPSRPLALVVGDRMVRALGTAFNVAITPDQRIELIVTEGKVLVGLAGKDAVNPGATPAPVAAESSVPVAAGERIVLDESNGSVEPIEPEEVEVRLSWRGGNLIFRGESLAEALKEIERYTPIEFVIQDENLKKVRIVGMFKAGDVDGLLATLRNNFDIAYQRVSDEKVILTSAAAP